MRWFWFDRYLEFQSGKNAVSIKNVSLAEEHLHDHFPGYPVMPNSLIIEGIAQTAGLLVSEAREFRCPVVLAKLSKAKFHTTAHPGDTLTYRVEVKDIREDGAFVSATSHIGEKLQCEIDIFFAYLSDRADAKPLFKRSDMATWLHLTHIFEIGKNADGSPLTAPADLVANS